MIRAAVLGSPISHSLSPVIHRRAYELLGCAGEYSAIELNSQTFTDFFANQKDQDWSGFSLTMPLKEVAFDIECDIDDSSKQIHSVNTLYREGLGWHGTSTDRLAFESILKRFSFSRVALIGAGGTARAAIGALRQTSAELTVLLRNELRIPELEKAGNGFTMNFLSLDADLSQYDLVISTVPKGVTDEIARAAKPSGSILFESLYSPWPTNLAKSWIEKGEQVISGIDLLVEQALFQISLMTKMEFNFTSMRESLLAEAWSHVQS